MSTAAKIALSVAVILVLIVLANWPSSTPGTSSRLPSLTVGNLERGNTHWRTILTVENQVEPRGFRLVGLQCTFFDGSIPIDTGGAVATNVGQGQKVYVDKLGPHSEKSVDRVECSVSYAHPN